MGASFPQHSHPGLREGCYCYYGYGEEGYGEEGYGKEGYGEEGYGEEGYGEEGYGELAMHT